MFRRVGHGITSIVEVGDARPARQAARSFSVQSGIASLLLAREDMALLPMISERMYTDDGAPEEQRGKEQALPETRKRLGLQ